MASHAARWLPSALVMLLATGVRHASAQPAFPPPAPPTLAASRASGPIVVDGDLTEPDWARTPVAADFVQAEPLQGEPATESTDVRVLFDDRYLYVGARCADRWRLVRSAAGYGSGRKR